MSALFRRGWGLHCGSWGGKGVEFGEDRHGVARADPLEYVVCLPQKDFGVRRLAGRDRSAPTRNLPRIPG